MQTMKCASPGSVTALNLSGFGLNGTLPESLGLLPLAVVDLSNNPQLRGRLPESVQRDTLLYVSTAHTAMTCHSGSLTAQQSVAFALQMRNTPKRELARRNWSVAEQPCIDIISRQQALEWQQADVVGYESTNGKIFKRCKLHTYPGSYAVADPNYVFSRGCRCELGGQPTFTVQNGLAAMLCAEAPYMWILAVVALSITAIHVLTSFYQYSSLATSISLQHLRSMAQPGTLVNQGSVRSSPLRL